MLVNDLYIRYIHIYINIVMDKSYYKNQIKIMFSGQNTFSTINTYDTNAKTLHCFSAYDNHYINPASILAFRDSYFNILNNEENRQKSVICVGGYYKHYYDINCQRSECIEKKSCDGIVNGSHQFTQKCKNYNCKKDGRCYGYLNASNTNDDIRKNNKIHNTKCLDCCICRCKCCNKPNSKNTECRYDVNVIACSCTCKDTCTNVEVQTFISETCKETEPYTFTAYRSLVEELNASIDVSSMVVNENNTFMNDKQSRVNVFLEIKENTVIQYSKKLLNKCNPYKGQKDNHMKKINSIVYGDHTVLETQFTKLFENRIFMPNDNIGCFLIIPIFKLRKIFQYAFSYHHGTSYISANPIVKQNVSKQNNSSDDNEDLTQCKFHKKNKPCYKINRGCKFNHSSFATDDIDHPITKTFNRKVKKEDIKEELKLNQNQTHNPIPISISDQASKVLKTVLKMAPEERTIVLKLLPDQRNIICNFENSEIKPFFKFSQFEQELFFGLSSKQQKMSLQVFNTHAYLLDPSTDLEKILVIFNLSSEHEYNVFLNLDTIDHTLFFNLSYNGRVLFFKLSSDLQKKYLNMPTDIMEIFGSYMETMWSIPQLIIFFNLSLDDQTKLGHFNSDTINTFLNYPFNEITKLLKLSIEELNIIINYQESDRKIINLFTQDELDSFLKLNEDERTSLLDIYKSF